MNFENVEIEKKQNRMKVTFPSELPNPIPSLDLDQVDVVEIDMTQVRNFYSLEIRSWMQWMESNFKNEEDLELLFSNIRLSIIQTQNYISGFVPLAYRIQSLIVIYYCEACDEEVEVNLMASDYLSKDKDLDELVKNIRKTSCPVCSGPAQAEFRPNEVAGLLLNIQNN